MSEWSKEHDWKSCMSRKGHRGFESLSLRQSSQLALLRLAYATFSKEAYKDWVGFTEKPRRLSGVASSEFEKCRRAKTDKLVE